MCQTYFVSVSDMFSLVDHNRVERWEKSFSFIQTQRSAGNTKSKISNGESMSSFFLLFSFWKFCFGQRSNENVQKKETNRFDSQIFLTFVKFFFFWTFCFRCRTIFEFFFEKFQQNFLTIHRENDSLLFWRSFILKVLFCFDKRMKNNAEGDHRTSSIGIRDGKSTLKRLKMSEQSAEEFFFRTHPFSDLVLLVDGKTRRVEVQLKRRKTLENHDLICSESMNWSFRHRSFRQRIICRQKCFSSRFKSISIVFRWWKCRYDWITRCFARRFDRITSFCLSSIRMFD